MNEKRDEMFDEFAQQVERIHQHSSQVEDLRFRATLKNGTSFNFHYNKAAYEREQSPQEPYQPRSLFNAIVDCVGAGLAAACLVLTLGVVWHIIFFGLLAATFVFSALDHFFDIRHEQAHKVFSNLREAFKILSIGTCNYCLALHTGMHVTGVVATTLLVGATALLLLSVQTKGAIVASLIATACMPFLALLSVRTLLALAGSALFSLWSVETLVISPNSKAKTNTVFGVIATVVSGLSLLGWGA